VKINCIVPQGRQEFQGKNEKKRKKLKGPGILSTPAISAASTSPAGKQTAQVHGGSPSGILGGLQADGRKRAVRKP